MADPTLEEHAERVRLVTVRLTGISGTGGALADDLATTLEAWQAERAARLAAEARVRDLEAERDAANRAWEPLCQQRNEAMEKLDCIAEALGRSLMTSDVHEGLPEAVAALRAELEALRAVAEAARTERDARDAWSAYCAGGPEAQIGDAHAAIDATDAALRRLDEVRRG